MLFETRIVIITGVIFTEELANNNDNDNIEDITWPRGDSNFVFECWKYLSRVSEANEWEILSARVMFCFVTLRQNQIHVQNHAAQGQPSQPIPLNIARYRKAVNSALWVQGTVGICYLPYNIAIFLTPQRGIPLSIYLATNFTATMVLLNSSLNPLLYCWKIREVRQAVTETLTQLCCWSS